MTKLKISPELSLPLDAASDVTAIVGRRGRGKTTAAVVLVEEAFRAGVRFCVVDPTGAWWGLRSSRDGKSPGIPCVVFGGKHAMVPLEPTAGKVIAEFVADPTQPSAIIDVKPWSRGEQVRFLADFLSTLYQKNDAPILLVLDEADQVAPQGKAESPGENVMLGAAQRLVKLGRVSGFGVVLVTQRPASLNKNVLNMAGILMAFGLTGPQDHKAVLDWMRHRADEGKAKEILASLPGLARGTAWVWAPEMELLARVAMRDRTTFDSSATPARGKRPAEPRALAEVDLQKLSADIHATIERTKADDPKALRARIAELERQLKSSPSAEPQRVEVPMFDPLAFEELGGEIAEHVRLALSNIRGSLHGYKSKCMEKAGATGGLAGAPRPAVAPRTFFLNERQELPPWKKSERVARSSADGDEKLGKCERMLLTAVAQHGRLTLDQAAIVAGYSPAASTTGVAASKLKRLGFLHGSNVDGLEITAPGRARLGKVPPLPTGDALAEYWFGQLGKCEREILRILVQHYPNPVALSDAATRAGYSTTASTTGVAAAKLRKLALVHGGNDGMTADERLVG